MMKKLFLLFAALSFVVLVLFGSFLWDGFFIAPGPDAEEVSFFVEPGLTLKQISFQLKDAGLIHSRFMFETYARLSGTASSFQAGNFDLSTGMSYASLVSTLTREAESTEMQVTIPEGYTLSQIEERVLAVFPQITHEEWVSATGSESPLIKEFPRVFSSLPEGHDLEGYLFPDTYRFSNSASAEAIARRMLETLILRMEAEGREDVFEGYGLGRLVNFSFHDVLTLASIVEREAQSAEDMKLVAGVFGNRLQIGMALQSDATVTYITGGKDPSPTFEETRVESPYNTYLHPGLPPGPVSHPGLNAIVAVLEPTPSEFFYFLTTPEGEFIYSETFEEHVANKNRYLK